MSQSSYTLVLLSEVLVGKRKRELTADAIPELMESITTLGLLYPITLTEQYHLVAGFYRLEACKRLQWETIPATVKTLDDLTAELIEIDENLRRVNLTELEEAELLARRKDIYEARYPETKKGQYGGGKGEKTKRKSENDKMSFSEDTAVKTKKTLRAIQHKIAIATKLDHEVKELLKER
jgi:hypothetical protein